VERTFQTNAYFREKEVQNALIRVLIAYAQYEPAVGYVQGMNFIAGALFYHASEVCTFWLLISMMEKYELIDVFK
jgi:hypothetical protein